MNDNNRKLDFARQVLSKEQFDRLYKSYRQLFWFQITPVIAFAALAVLVMIFVPSQDVPNGYADMKMTILMFGTAFFLVPFLPAWLIVSQFASGKLWHRYIKWHKKGKSLEELYDIFD